MKSMNGLAELALQVPDKIIHLLKIMEREAKPTPGSFKPVEAFCHPEDYRKLVDKFLAEEKRTVDLFRKHCDQILKNRYWRWILMHPGLGEDRIHPSRSMLLNPYPNVFKIIHFPFVSHMRHVFSFYHRERGRDQGDHLSIEGPQRHRHQGGEVALVSR